MRSDGVLIEPLESFPCPVRTSQIVVDFENFVTHSGHLLAS
jgi:hypothetical protein